MSYLSQITKQRQSVHFVIGKLLSGLIMTSSVIKNMSKIKVFKISVVYIGLNKKRTLCQR